MKKTYDKTPFDNALGKEFSDFVEEVYKEGGDKVQYTRSLFVNAIGSDGSMGIVEVLKGLVASKSPEAMREGVKSLFDVEVTFSIKGSMVSVLKEIDMLIKDDAYFNTIVGLAESSVIEGQPAFRVEALTLKEKVDAILVEDKPGGKVSEGAN